MAETDAKVLDADSELMLRARGGDLRSFEMLFRKYAKGIMNFVRRFVGSQAVAEELTQEIFLKLYRAREEYQPLSRFSTYLYRVATNHCLNELRRGHYRARFEPVEGSADDGEPGAQLADGSPGAEELALARELVDAVEAALQSLPDSQRAALLLLRYEGLSYEEIAEALELSVPAVKSLLNRAKTSLKERLAGYLGEGDELHRVQGKG